jgi:hypothetical protein
MDPVTYTSLLKNRKAKGSEDDYGNDVIANCAAEGYIT